MIMTGEGSDPDYEFKKGFVWYMCIIRAAMQDVPLESPNDEKKKKNSTTSQISINKKRVPQQTNMTNGEILYGNETTLAVSEEDNFKQRLCRRWSFVLPLNSTSCNT